MSLKQYICENQNNMDDTIFKIFLGVHILAGGVGLAAGTINMFRQTVYSISGNSEMLMNIDVSHLQTGIYIVEAYSGSGINTAKVIVGN
jgi:hypothetical protein